VFTGQEHDENTGLVYFGARYYDPDAARFLNQDSYLGEANNPPSLHRFLYAHANPTVYIDLHGNAGITVGTSPVPDPFSFAMMRHWQADYDGNGQTVGQEALAPVIEGVERAWSGFKNISPLYRGSSSSGGVESTPGPVERNSVYDAPPASGWGPVLDKKESLYGEKRVQAPSIGTGRYEYPVDSGVEPLIVLENPGKSGDEPESGPYITPDDREKMRKLTEQPGFNVAPQLPIVTGRPDQSDLIDSGPMLSEGFDRNKLKGENISVGSVGEAKRRAKKRANIPGYLQPTNRWTVGGDEARRGQEGYIYSDNTGEQGQYWQYETEHGSRVIVVHDQDSKGAHAHAGQPKGGQQTVDFSDPDVRYEPVGGKHHIFIDQQE
jgi:RHS repeat-associated protein